MVSRATIPGTVISTDDLTHTMLNSLPGGVVAYKVVTQNSGLIYNLATLTSFDTGPVVTYDNRIYRITFRLHVQQTDPDPATGTFGQLVRLWLTDGDDNAFVFQDVNTSFFPPQNAPAGRSYLHIDPGAGVRRYKVRAQINQDNDHSLIFAACDESVPGYIMVEDVGPSTGYS